MATNKKKPINILEENSTNQILVEQSKSKKEIIYHLPCYVRFKVKAITEISLDSRQGSLDGTILFSFYYGELDQNILDQFTTCIKKQEEPIDRKEWKKDNASKKAILLQFARQETIQLRQEKDITQKIDRKQKIMTFIIRKEFVCELHGEVFYTPFQIINLFLTITVQSLPLYQRQNNGKSITIKFNCMSNQKISLLSHGAKTEFGHYKIASSLLDTKYKDDEENPFEQISFCQCWCKGENENLQQINQEKEDEIEEIEEREDKKDEMDETSVIKIKSTTRMDNQRFPTVPSSGWNTIEAEGSPSKTKVDRPQKSKLKIKNYQYVHFRIPLYKRPTIILFSIFIPLWVIGFINLFIFFQDRSLSGRIASIAVLTLAYIAFIPTIDAQIPQTPSIKLVDILIYMEILASILCLIQSFYTKDDVSDYNWKVDGFFIVSLILNILTFVIEMVLLIIYQCYWKGIYHNESKKPQGLSKRQGWKNEECDQMFSNHIKEGKIKALTQKQI